MLGERDAVRLNLRIVIRLLGQRRLPTQSIIAPYQGCQIARLVLGTYLVRPCDRTTCQHISHLTMLYRLMLPERPSRILRVLGLGTCMWRGSARLRAKMLVRIAPAGTDACCCSFEILRGRHYVIVLLGWLPDVCSIGSAKSKIVPGHELIFCHLSFSRDLPRLRLINTCPGARCAGLSR
jgi:hypothetical protein